VHRKFKLPARPKFTPVRGRPALGSASDKKNSVNLPLVLGLNRILTRNDAAAKRIWVHLHLPYADRSRPHTPVRVLRYLACGWILSAERVGAKSGTSPGTPKNRQPGFWRSTGCCCRLWAICLHLREGHAKK